MANPPAPHDIFALSTPERLLLAGQLLDSVISDAMPLTPDQMAEVKRRVAALDAGEIGCEPWEVVRDQLFDRYR